jgi:hypothetical protein
MGGNSRNSSGGKGGNNRPTSRSIPRGILDSIETRIQSAFPEDEQEKINKVMLLLFGPEPDRFVVPEQYRYLDDEP